MQPGQATCGAKTRKGSPCKDIAMANGRCKRHGGKSTGAHKPATGRANGNSNSGIYSRFLSEADQALYAEVELGHVDAELRLTRIRLARTVKARHEWEASLESPVRSDGESSLVHIETVDDESVTKDGDVVPTTKKVHRLPPFDEIENRLLARIESLEKTRRELMKPIEGDDPSDPDSEPGRDRVTFTGGLGGDDDDLPDPFSGKTKK